jgi:hypothetical protein
MFKYVLFQKATGVRRQALGVFLPTADFGRPTSDLFKCNLQVLMANSKLKKFYFLKTGKRNLLPL